MAQTTCVPNGAEVTVDDGVAVVLRPIPQPSSQLEIRRGVAPAAVTITNPDHGELPEGEGRPREISDFVDEEPLEESQSRKVSR
ncbi:hypothetical protein FS842_006518 [Serendipita sp. 407]|nr:hypothetical protein FS842_006518 [Serendipita sp. 407]